MNDTLPKVPLPTIHLNGTSQDRLLDDVTEIELALRAAMDVMATRRPNARDYYPQGPDAFPKAADAHEDRMARVKAVFDEFFALADGIAGGGHKE